MTGLFIGEHVKSLALEVTSSGGSCGDRTWRRAIQIARSRRGGIYSEVFLAGIVDCRSLWVVEPEVSLETWNLQNMDQLLASKNNVSTGPQAASRVRANRRRLIESVWLMIAVALIVRVVVMRFSYL